jgi:uncharacterized membrane protein
MGTLTGWRFDSEDGADKAVATLEGQAPHLVFTTLSNEREKTLREASAE